MENDIIRPKVMACGRWNRHSSQHQEARALWKIRNAHDVGKASDAELAAAQDDLAKLVIRELESCGVDYIEDGGIRLDSIFDIARRIGGCEGFAMLSRIPETNHFHRQAVARLPLMHNESLRGDDLAFARQHTKKSVVMSLVGPYTLARQTRNVHEVGLERFALAYATALRVEVEALVSAGAVYVRIEEPQILTHPLDRDLFERVMHQLTEGVRQDRLMLASWFADVPDVKTYFSLPFGSFWVDVVEGRGALDAMKYFPEGKMFVAGIVDARQPIAESIELLETRYGYLRRFLPTERIVLAPNADLDFLPWNEAVAKVKTLVAFASLCEAPFSAAHHLREPLYKRIQVAIKYPVHEPHAIPASVSSAAKPYDVSRILAHTDFPTSTVGSFPQPQEVRSARVALRKGEMAADAYRRLVEEYTLRWIIAQEELDITVPVGGEILREDMAAYFGIKLGGALGDFVPSYENRRYRPVIYDKPIVDAGAMIIDDFSFLQSLTRLPMKETLTGPATLADWGLLKLSEYWRDRGLFKRDLAAALRCEIGRLIDAGARIIQIDEPALTTKMRGFESDIAAIRQSFEGFEDRAYFILHICYSDMEALDAAFPEMLKLPFHQIHMEMANRGYALISLIEKYGFGGKDIGLGVTDVHTDRIETVDEIVAGVERTLTIRHDGKKVFAPRQLWLTPDCGLKERSDKVTLAKLHVMCEAARILRKRYA
ncbi:MAG: hypothetical protein Q8Q39_03640 [bacterium]|nr:hypothetical protein [bacterium]